MNTSAYVAILGWICIGLWAFASLKPHRAVLTLVVVGFCFLPVEIGRSAGLFPWEKREAIGLALLLGVLLFDSKEVLRFRLSWVDVPVLCWLLAAPISSLANHHGLYDAVSAFMHRILLWGSPYFVGAMYLRSRQSLRDCLWAVFLGGLAYAPLCLIEVRMSPQFHYWVYGVQQSTFNQTKRGGGFRPMVFMDHGLQASLWMATAMMAGAGLWWLLRVRRFRGIPMGWSVAAIALAWLLSKSTGAIMLGFLGLVMLAFPRAGWMRLGVMVAVVGYLGLRLFGDGELEQALVDAAGLVSAERAESLQFRYTNEAALLDRFWLNRWVGSSPWGFNTFVIGETGFSRSVAVPDSLWIYAVSINGLLGIFGVMGSLWLPVARAIGLLSRWRDRIAPEPLICGLIVMFYLTDSLVNGFKTPIYVLMAGGLSRVSPLLARATVTAPTPAQSQAQSDRAVPASVLRPRSANSAVRQGELLSPRRLSTDTQASSLRSQDIK